MSPVIIVEKSKIPLVSMLTPALFTHRVGGGASHSVFCKNLADLCYFFIFWVILLNLYCRSPLEDTENSSDEPGNKRQKTETIDSQDLIASAETGILHKAKIRSQI